jgi:hypothetical protein
MTIPIFRSWQDQKASDYISYIQYTIKKSVIKMQKYIKIKRLNGPENNNFSVKVNIRHIQTQISKI